jgi:hypothetical protein
MTKLFPFPDMEHLDGTPEPKYIDLMLGVWSNEYPFNPNAPSYPVRPHKITISTHKYISQLPEIVKKIRNKEGDNNFKPITLYSVVKKFGEFIPEDGILYGDRELWRKFPLDSFIFYSAPLSLSKKEFKYLSDCRSEELQRPTLLSNTEFYDYCKYNEETCSVVFTLPRVGNLVRIVKNSKELIKVKFKL